MKNNIIFNGVPVVPYMRKVKTGSFGNKVYMIYYPNGRVKRYDTMNELKQENPRFRNITRAYINLDKIIDRGRTMMEVWISQLDAKVMR